MPRKKKIAPKPEKQTYTCLCCGIEKPETEFYSSKWSPMWIQSNKKVLFCKSCINKRFDEFRTRYQSDRTALLLCCYILDIPFYATLFESIVKNNDIFSCGMYLRMVQMQQYQMKSFANTLVSDELSRSDKEVKEEIESRWSKSDRQNKNFVINTVGYDPFENCGMTDNDRKYCFNVLAGYCDCDGIQEDGHKMQSVIQMTNSQLQCRKLDEFINLELLKISPDQSAIKAWGDTKKNLLSTIAQTAKDNNISSAYNSSSKQGTNTLSAKMKEMAQNGYEAIQVNLFDIKTSEAMKQIADLSNRSILEQITLDSNDYTQMIKDQREMIQKFESERDTLAEENRQLKNQVIDLTTKKK